MHECLFDGAPVRIRYRANLRDTAGNPAHAATFIRTARIVLDPESEKESRGSTAASCSTSIFISSGFGWVTRAARAWEALLAVRMEIARTRRSGLVGRMAQEQTLSARRRRPLALLARILLRKFLRYRRLCFRTRPRRLRSHAVTRPPAAPALAWFSRKPSRSRRFPI